MKAKQIPLGTSDFKAIREDNRYFVDKSLFIKDVVTGSNVLLFARPRRFGKTLNLSMLSYFYDNKEDNAHLFDTLKITAEPDIMKKQGKHPVIFMSLKDIENDTAEECIKELCYIISDTVGDYEYLLKSDKVSIREKECLLRMIKNTADYNDFTKSLRVLCKALHQHHNAKSVILIDEYDTPIHDAYFHDYYDGIIKFMKDFLGSALKDNNCLEKAVLTGIFRVSKESMFSGLNNIEVCTMTEPTAADKFGFTEEEVAEMLDYYSDSENKQNRQLSLVDIKQWYDGYNFENVEIYNPWSILYSIKNRRLDSYWLNTSGNDLVKELCQRADLATKQDFEILIQGDSIRKQINDNIVFADLESDKNAIWSFLLHSGYLRYDNLETRYKSQGKIADISIPNQEIEGLFIRDVIPKWFTIPKDTMMMLSRLMDNLTNGDVELFKSEFVTYCENSISYYDIDKANPEKIYHVFILGMLYCVSDRYHVRSNRESGTGRCDVMLIPIYPQKTHRGVVFEFKRVDKDKGETVESAIKTAREQISTRKYSQELRAVNCKQIVYVIVVFEGKEVYMDIRC